ncbi:MAG TPA: phospholipase [Ktedonobacterales bacterium]|nr:phospholipase [Ktedonobacterales bacterium]
MTEPDGVALSLVHLKRAPHAASAGKPPLLLLLHGVGSNERDLFSFADAVDPRFLVLSLRAPLVRGPDSFAWFNVQFLPQGGYAIAPDQLRASRDVILTFIGEAIRAYGADAERVYLLGFSQGAIMSLTTLLSSPSTLAGIVALSGRIPPEVIPWIAPQAELAGAPVLVIHGTLDAVIPIDYARRAREVLEALPVDLTYLEYPLPHTIGERTLAASLAWLTAHLDAPRRSAAAPEAE